MPVTHVGIFIVFLTVVTPAVAVAQLDQFNIPPGPRRVDVSGSGGFLLSTDWSDLVLLGSVSPVGGALEQLLVRDLVVLTEAGCHVDDAGAVLGRHELARQDLERVRCVGEVVEQRRVPVAD